MQLPRIRMKGSRVCYLANTFLCCIYYILVLLLHPCSQCLYRGVEWSWGVLGIDRYKVVCFSTAPHTDTRTFLALLSSPMKDVLIITTWCEGFQPSPSCLSQVNSTLDLWKFPHEVANVTSQIMGQGCLSFITSDSSLHASVIWDCINLF